MLPKLTRDKPNWWAQSASVILATWSVGRLIEGWNFVIPWTTMQQKENDLGFRFFLVNRINI